jgi:presequence protease
MTLVHGFELVEEREIPEIASLARLWRHGGSGAELLSLLNDDENKVFGVSLRTPPRNSTGVAHILEHSVLCGSRKYPLKEPFVELLKGSLKTFLNAFTYPDKTCYPVASCHLQDFYNLIDVYMDAVFHPLLPEHVFRQEGWRLTPSEDAPHGLEMQGVVLNEMKGAYSSPDAVLHERAQQAVFPETIYGLDSGGDPEIIPELGHEEFLAFHRTYYHPSNARFFFHGNDPEEHRLELVNEVIAPFGRLEVDSAIRMQPPFSEPRRLILPYAAEPDDSGRKRGMFVLNWLFPGERSFTRSLAWSMLETMLVGLPGAPLRKALLDSGLGEDLAGVGLESELMQSYFSTGLRNMDPERSGEVEKLILRTLETLAREGLPPELVEAAVNSTEFDLRENNTGSFPRGLHLMLRSLTNWLYGWDPLEPLAFEAPLAAIKERVQAGERFFENMLRELFLENPSRGSLLLVPDEELDRRAEEREQGRLAGIVASMSTEQLRELEAAAEELARLQQAPDAPEALQRLPRLRLTDLPRRNTSIPLEECDIGGRPCLFHDIETTGLLYADLAFDLRPLLERSPALAPLVPLFGRALLEMGTSRRDYVSMSTLIARKTGGIEPDMLITPVQGSEQARVMFLLRCKCTLEKASDLAAILEELLAEARFDDEERLRQLLQEELAGLEERVIPMGHRMALSRVMARLSEAGRLNEYFNGVSQLLFLRRLSAATAGDLSPVQGALEAMRSLILNRENLLSNVTTPESGFRSADTLLAAAGAVLPVDPGLDAAAGGLEALLGEAYAYPEGAALGLERGREGLTIPANVNFVAKGVNLRALDYEFDGAALVASRLLSTGWLWDSVRVQGGAYGAFCLLDRIAGCLAFASYRDPGISRTIDIFDKSGQYLRGIKHDSSLLEKGVIGVVGDIDAHLLPDAKGYASLLRWCARDDEQTRQRMRDQVLEAGAEQFERLAQACDKAATAGDVSVLGSRQSLERFAAEGWSLERLL